MARKRTQSSKGGQDPPTGTCVQEDSAYDCDTEATQTKELTCGQKAVLTRKRNQMAQMMVNLDNETTGKKYCTVTHGLTFITIDA